MPHSEIHPQSFFRRSLVASVAIGLLAALFIAVYAGLGFAGRYLVFLVWMLANLLLLGASFRELLGRRRILWLVPLGAANILWLAAVVFVYIALVGSSAPRIGDFVAFLAGFNTPFLVMILKAGGAVIAPRLSRSSNGVKRTIQ